MEEVKSKVMARAGSTNGNKWKKRTVETIECPSGQIVKVQRPGPEFVLRAGKVARTFSDVAGREKTKDKDYLMVIAEMSDEELTAVMIFARELVCAMLVSPRLVREPKGEDEIGPEDIGDDFWVLFNYAMTGYFNLAVPVAEGEVKVENLETFRSESGISGTSDNRSEVQPNTEQSIGNQGLVDSAGAGREGSALPT